MPDNGQKIINPRHQLLIKISSFFCLGAIIAAMIVLGPSPLLYALFAMLAALFILPDNYLLGLALIIALTMIFERFFTLQGLIVDRSIYKFYLLDVVIILSFLAGLANWRNKEGRQKLIFGWPEKILLIYLALVAVYLIRSWFDLNAEFDSAFSSFKNYFFYPLLYFFVIFFIDSAKKFKDTIHLLLMVAAGLIGFIFIGLINGGGLWTEYTPLSTYGSRYLAGTHAFYMMLALMIAAALLVYRRLRNESFSFMIAGLWTLGIGVSLMRHLWLAAATGLAALFLLIDNKHKKIMLAYLGKAALAAATGLAVIILAVSLLYIHGANQNVSLGLESLAARLSSFASLNQDTSAAWRLDLWHDAQNVWQKNPIFGVGFGHTILIDSGNYQAFEQIRNVHNSPLSIAVQMGILGLLAFSLFVLAVLAGAYRPMRRHSDLQPYYLGIFAALIAFIVASFFQPYLETNLMGLWLWLLLGLLRTADLIKDKN